MKNDIKLLICIFLLIITMNSLFPLFTTTISRLIILLIVILILLLCSPSSFCSRQPPPLTSSQGLVVGEKTRLGSTPPSCHNKCNECHPCMAVQVPTLPKREPVGPNMDRTVEPVVFFDSPRNKYSNYKPLGWKCRCGNHFFNP